MSLKLLGISHLRVINAFEKAGFKVLRQGKHVVMRRGDVFITIPRHNPVKRFTLEGIVKDSGLSMDEFIDYL